MSDSAATSTFVCPNCRAKWQLPAGVNGASIRCGRCGTALSANQPAPAAIPDELDLAPIPHEPPPKPRIRPEIDDGTEYELAPLPIAPAPPPLPPPSPARPAKHAESRRSASQPTPPPLPSPPRASPSVAAALPQTVLDEDQTPSYIVEPPPGASLGWAMSSNVFEFPWTSCAILQWIYSSLGLMLAGVITWQVAMMLSHLSLLGPVILPAAALAIVITLPYVAACLYDITLNAAYNCDKLRDWPHADLRERILYFVRVVYLLVLAALIAAGIAEICWLASGVFWPVFAAVPFLLFPILFLSVQEAATIFWPVSQPIFRSLPRLSQAWFVFYCLSALLIAACSFLTFSLFKSIPSAWPIASAPAWAATVFIYGRLLGRLAWFIMLKQDLLDDSEDDTSDQATSAQSRRANKRAARMRELARWDI